jgi:hypothetical protein
MRQILRQAGQYVHTGIFQDPDGDILKDSSGRKDFPTTSSHLH